MEEEADWFTGGENGQTVDLRWREVLRWSREGLDDEGSSIFVCDLLVYLFFYVLWNVMWVQDEGCVKCDVSTRLNVVCRDVS